MPAEPTIALDAAGDVQMPVQRVLTGRGAIFGKSGSGKSNSANVIAEGLLEQGYPIMVVDPEGEYWGLKEEFELLRAGAGEEADLVVGPEHGERLARLALEDDVPIILDLSGYLDEETAREIVYETARHLFHLEDVHQQPFLLVVEEAHEYLPQSGSLDDCGRMLVRIGKRGRKRGLGLVAASQRPAAVDKDYITQADWLLWHRLTWDNDVRVVRDVLGSTYADQVDELANGEGFLRTDWAETVDRIQVREQRTFDAGATPSLEGYERPELRSVGEDLLDELDAISEQHEQRQDELARLEDLVDDKDERIAELEERVERLVDLRQMVESTEGLGPEQQAPQEVTVDLGDKELALPDIRAEVLEVRRERDDLEETVQELRDERDRLARRVDELEDRPDVSAYEDLASEVEELVERHRDVLDVAGDDVDERLRQRLQEAEARVAELEGQGATDGPDVTDDPLMLIELDVIQDEIARVAARSQYADQHFHDVVRGLALNPGEWFTAAEITPFIHAGEDAGREVLKALAKTGFVEWDHGSPFRFRLDDEAMQHRIEIVRGTSQATGEGSA